MSPIIFYREQAAQQRRAANLAVLANVRERCRRASDAWTALATRSERDGARPAASGEPPAGAADQEHAIAPIGVGDPS